MCVFSRQSLHFQGQPQTSLWTALPSAGGLSTLSCACTKGCGVGTTQTMLGCAKGHRAPRRQKPRCQYVQSVVARASGSGAAPAGSW